MSAVQALLLILLCQAYFPHNEAALVVFAPTPQKAELGKNVVLPCSFKVDGSSINLQFLAILWLFQGKEVFRFDNKGTSSLPKMFINEQDIPKGNANLEIKNVTIADIGQYRCMVIYSPQKEYKDVDLSVYASPSITIENVEKEDKTKFALCSVTGFYPRDITVEILKDGKVTEDSVLSEYHTNDDGTFSVKRTWKVPSDVSPKMLSCVVYHETVTPHVQKDLQVVYEGDNNATGVVVGCVVGVIVLILAILLILWINKKKSGQKHVVYDIESPVCFDGEKTTLSCKASNCIGAVQVIWFVKLRDSSEIKVSDAGLGDEEEEQPLMSREYLVTKDWDNQKAKGHITTKLAFIPSISRHLGSTITCRIIHKKKCIEKTCEMKSIYAKPKFAEPAQFTLSDKGDVQTTVTLQRFYPQEIEVNWFSKCGESEEKIPSEVILKNSGNMFDLESKCSVSGEKFNDSKYKVIVRWKHKSMEKEQSRELSVRDLPWRPKLQNIPIETVFQGDEIVLQCRVSDYFPNALAVKWFEKQIGSQNLDEISSSQKYNIPEISSYRMENQTFSSTSVLSYKRSDLSEKGIEFICRVEHPSLESPFQNSILQYRDTEVPTFVVNNIQGPQTWYRGEKVTLYFSASYCLEGTQVIWMVKAAGVTICEIDEGGADVSIDPHQSSGYVAHRERTEVSDKEGLQDVTSSLTFTPDISKHQNISIACKILSDGKLKEKTFQRKYLYAKPSVSGPIKLSLTDSGEVLCSLNIEGFYPSDISVKWNDKDTLHLHGTSQNIDGTYMVQSDCKLPKNFFSHSDSAVDVSWKHNSMEDWQRRQLSPWDKEFPWKANVQDIPVPNLLIGRTATLKCEVSNVFPDNLCVKWFKKEKGNQDLFPVIPSQAYNISDLRAEKQKDNTFTYKPCLKFKPSISTEEEAEFICRVEHPTLKGPVEKSTGPLTIQGFPKVKDIVCDAKDTYSLEVDGFYPQSITISWRLSGQSSTLENDSVTSDVTYEANEDGSYRAKSTCDLTKTNNNLEKWSNLEARVEHETLDNPIVKTKGIKIAAPLSQDGRQDLPTEIPQEVPVIGSVSAPPPTDIKTGVQENSQQDSHNQIPQDVSKTVGGDKERIIIGEVKGPCRWIHGEKVTLYCSVSYCSEDTRVMWMVEQTDGKEEEISSTGGDPMSDSSYTISEDTDKSDREGLFNRTYLLTLVPSVSKHIGVFIACRISSDGQTKTKRFQPKSIYAKPQVMEPVKTSLCDGGDVLCSLSFQNLYPKHFKVIWQSGKEEKEVKSKEECIENNDHTYNVHSFCTVPGNLLSNPNFSISVTWSHKSLETQQSQVLSWRDPGLPWSPVIEEVPIAHILIERQNTLQYNISRYFPDAVSVSWYRKEKGGQEYILLSNNEKFEIPDIQSQKQSDHTYSCTARLLLKPTVGDGESEIMCKVSHPSLERPIERRSGPLQVQAKPKAKRPIKTSRGTGEMIFSCMLENFYPKDIQMDWCYWSEERLAQPCPSKEKPKPMLNKTFSVTSECRVPENLLHNPNSRISLTWRHESMDEEEYKEFRIRDKDPEQQKPCKEELEPNTAIQPPESQLPPPQESSNMTDYQNSPGVSVPESQHPPSQSVLHMMRDQNHPDGSVSQFHHPPSQDMFNIMSNQHHSGVPSPQAQPESHHLPPKEVSNMMGWQHPPGVQLPQSQHPHPQDVFYLMRDQNHSGVSVSEFHHPPSQDMFNIMSNQHHPGVPSPQAQPESHHLPPQDVYDMRGLQHPPGFPAPESQHPPPQDVLNLMMDQNHPGVPVLELHHPSPSVSVAESQHPPLQNVLNTMRDQNHSDVLVSEFHHPPPQDMFNTMSNQHHPGVPSPQSQLDFHHFPPQDASNTMGFAHHPGVPVQESQHLSSHDFHNMIGHPSIPTPKQHLRPFSHNEEEEMECDDAFSRKNCAEQREECELEAHSRDAPQDVPESMDI